MIIISNATRGQLEVNQRFIGSHLYSQESVIQLFYFNV